MNIIEKGKNFDDVLSIEDLEKIQGGVFCIKYSKCTTSSDNQGMTNSCGILIGNPDKDVDEG